MAIVVVSLDSILHSLGMTRDQLAIPCPADYCNELARNLDRWELLAKNIGLSQGECTVIWENHSRDYELQRSDMLSKWKTKYASEATYLKLALGLEKIQRLDLVKDLCRACNSSSRDECHGGGEKELLQHTETVTALLDHGAQVNLQDKDGDSALINASREGHTETVTALLDHGAQVDLQGEDGDSALINASREGHTETVKVLLNRGARVDLQNKHGKSALIKASSRGHTETVKVLLGKGAKVDLQDKDGDSALTNASREGHAKTVRVLLDYHARVDLQDEDGDSALISASYKGHTEIVEALLHHEARVDLQNKHGKSALIKASSRGHTETVKVLLGKGAQVDLQNKYGESALIKASWEGHTETVRVLLDHDAKINLQNKKGDSALKLAQDKGHHEVVQLLSKKGRLTLPNTLRELLPLASERQNIGTLPPGERQVHPPSPSPTLPNTLKELLTLASDWQNIGTLLEIPPGTLEGIKSENSHRVKDCLREMLTEWLKTIHPTWENLADATHPFNQIKAMEIRHKYCTTLTS